jgi:hypothetical protein
VNCVVETLKIVFRDLVKLILIIKIQCISLCLVILVFSTTTETEVSGERESEFPKKI